MLESTLIELTSAVNNLTAVLKSVIPGTTPASTATVAAPAEKPKATPAASKKTEKAAAPTTPAPEPEKTPEPPATAAEPESADLKALQARVKAVYKDTKASTKWSKNGNGLTAALKTWKSEICGDAELSVDEMDEDQCVKMIEALEDSVL